MCVQCLSVYLFCLSQKEPRRQLETERRKGKEKQDLSHLNKHKRGAAIFDRGCQEALRPGLFSPMLRHRKPLQPRLAPLDFFGGILKPRSLAGSLLGPTKRISLLNFVTFKTLAGAEERDLFQMQIYARMRRSASQPRSKSN